MILVIILEKTKVYSKALIVRKKEISHGSSILQDVLFEVNIEITRLNIINRPGIAEAVLQSPPSLIHSLIDSSFGQNIF